MIRAFFSSARDGNASDAGSCRISPLKNISVRAIQSTVGKRKALLFGRNLAEKNKTALTKKPDLTKYYDAADRT
ncbi:hypothetical protein [uncultured Ruminococcus sp.]|uniref:hypothetical protein n=1 Tax=uncultured Ruminococcus sp. TaxID=165186 RepID=UPI0025FB5C2B|nr:hypothetical protein [uncultured Ruminococcus sp.]